MAAASKYYFDKKPADLEPAEAAMLIGLSNSPSAYNPVAHPKAAKQKRNEVLLKMYEGGAITKKEYNKAVKTKPSALQITEKTSNESYLVSYAVHCAAISLMEKENFELRRKRSMRNISRSILPYTAPNVTISVPEVISCIPR